MFGWCLVRVIGERPGLLAVKRTRAIHGRHVAHPAWRLRQGDAAPVRASARATAAAGFLTPLERRMPFRIRAPEVDGGRRVAAGFEAACQSRSFRLFVPPPRPPNPTARWSGPSGPHGGAQ